METHESCYQFTPRAAQAMLLAEKEATRLKHNFVGTEHLLLGIVRLGEETSAAQVLKVLGVLLEQVGIEMEKVIGQIPEVQKAGKIPLTPRTQKVLSLSDKERKLHNHAYLGTEHILLGILREGEGTAARCLKNFGVSLETARQRVLELHPPDPVTEAAPRVAKEQNLDGLFRTATAMLENPPRMLRITPRVWAAICALDKLDCGNEERENLFLAVLAHLRDKEKK